MHPTKRKYFECSICEKVYKTVEPAESCCQPKTCKCGKVIDKKYSSICDACYDAERQLLWECSERGDATPVMYSETEQFYFCCVEELTDKAINDLNLDADDIEVQEIEDMSLPELARRYQVYLTEPYIAKDGINLHEYFDYDEDEYGNDMVLPDGWEEAENAVNNWIKSVPLDKWPVCPSDIAWSGK